MSGIRFEWDPRKAAANLAEHGVSFPEAATVFADDFALLIPDPDHSDKEDRFILLGLSTELRLLVEVHCDRSGPEDKVQVIHIISARRATPRERDQHHERNQP